LQKHRDVPASHRAGRLARVPKLIAVVASIAFVVTLGAFGLSGRSAVHGYTVQTVEVSEAGFNPAVCRMNREYVRFKNVGSTPRRVIRPGVVAADPPLIDTGYIKPGEYSNEILIPHGGTTEFYDADDLAHSMTVVTPVFVEYWDPICTADPNYTPPQPPCRKNPYCVRAPVMARD
jgi:hypothetical protein